MSTTLPTNQVYDVGIGDFELAFMIRLWYCSGTPDGWMWAAIAEDNMSGWFHGGRLLATDTAALNAAVAHLTAIFN